MGEQERPSRRTLLRTAGVVGAASALGVRADPASAGDVPAGMHEADGTVPGAAQPASGAPSAGPTAGTRYVMYSQLDLQPNDLDGGRRVSSIGAYPAHLDTYMVIPVHLPMNSIITELQVVAYNNSGASRTVRLERFSLYANTANDVVSLTLPVAGGLQTIGQTLHHVVSSEHAYDLSLFEYVTGTVRLYSARIGFRGPFGYFPVQPQVRRLDTRVGGLPSSGKIVAGGTKSVTFSPTVPAVASSVVVNVTVTDTEGSGWLAAYPLGSAWPGTSNINWSGPGQTVANSAIVPVGSSAGIQLLCGGTGAKAHVIVDLVGYYD